MDVRDAVEADAPALAAIADAPTDAMGSVIHDRTVRVAIDDSSVAPDEEETVPSEMDTDPTEKDTDSDGEKTDSDEEKTDSNDVLGFLSFDAREGMVHVTQFGGTEAAIVRLLEEPVRFASSESMGVELLVVEGESEMHEAAETAGFERDGPGPRFEGKPTTRYRIDAPET